LFGLGIRQTYSDPSLRLGFQKKAILAIPAILAISKVVVLFLSLQDNRWRFWARHFGPERTRFYNPAVHPCRMLLAVKRESTPLMNTSYALFVEKECSRVVRAFEPKLDRLPAVDHVLRGPAA
jgi:hypothetical protein